MKKLLSLFTLSLFICFSALQTCYAKTSLTHFNTVVIEEQRETSREEVINQVNKQAEDNFYDNANLSNMISVFTKSSLKSIINSASNTFFQK